MTTPTITFLNGYEARPYLSDDYMIGEVEYGWGAQATMVVNSTKVTGQQGTMVVAAAPIEGQQATMVVNSTKLTGQQALMNVVDKLSLCGMQTTMVIGATTTLGAQATMVVGAAPVTGQQARMFITDSRRLTGVQAVMIVGATPMDGQQADLVVLGSKHTGMQSTMILIAAPTSGMQAELDTRAAPRTGMSGYHDTLRHAHREYYLEDGYLTGPYLVEAMEAFPGMQARMVVNATKHTGVQAKMIVNATKLVGSQGLMIVNKTTPRGMQATFTINVKIGAQAAMVVYNDTQLRILDTFPSRGTTALGGNNWTATNQAAGDFLPSNLNTDIEEQVFRSSLPSVDLVCDTGVVQGVTIDTIAILNHNLTADAQVQVQGSNDNFASIAVNFDMVAETTRMFYVANQFPVESFNQNTKWRFVISDPTNPDGYVQIGMILFGNARIFSVHDNFENPLRRGYRHFKDSVMTEGFTNKMNDRALRRWLALSFANLERFRGSFKTIEDYVQFCRTSLKALVIPTPRYPSRFAVYAKLKDMPSPEHTNVANLDDPDGVAEYITLQLEWDESL